MAYYPILKLNVSSMDAISYYKRFGEFEKASNIENLINDTVIFDELLGEYNYFYSNITRNTKDIKEFKIDYGYYETEIDEFYLKYQEDIYRFTFENTFYDYN